MFDKTFENLLRGLDAKSDLNPLNNSFKKFDIGSRINQYTQGERDFIRLASEIDNDMRGKVSMLNPSKSSIQPILNDAFLRKPKRQADKSTLSNEARTSFVDLFDKMNNYWESSESKRKATQIFDIKLEGGDKDPNNPGGATQGQEEKQTISRNRKSSQFKLSPKGQILTANQMVTGDEATSPLEGPSKTFSKSYGKFLTVEINEKVKGRGSGDNDFVFERKNTPGVLKEDSLDTSHNFNLYKQAASLTQITASRDTLDKDDQEKEEDAREIERLREEEESKKRKEEEDRARKEEEEKRKKEEVFKKKVEGYIQKIPDYSFMFSNQIVEKSPENQ